MVKPQLSDEQIPAAPPASQSRLKKLLSKSPAGMLASLRWSIRNLTRETVCGFRFGLVTWTPKGSWPGFHAYYPDGMGSFPDLTDLYRRWIRGNKVNNNGDATRFIALMLNVRQLQNEGISGDFAELGVWKGNSAAILAHFASQSGRRLYLLTHFAGSTRAISKASTRAKTVTSAILR